MHKDILKTLADKLDERITQQNIIQWITRNKITNEKGEVMTFDRHPFLVDIYNDMSIHQVQIKASQIGMSTAAIMKEAYLAKTKNYNVIHTLPTADFSYDFVKSKVDPIFRINEGLFDVTKKTDSVRHKELGLAHLFYRGTFTEKEGITISADVLINDEYDRSNMEVCSVFESRLDFSDYKAIWRFSNPTIPDYGVDALFKRTNQQHWMIKCSHCGHWQYLMFPENIDFINKIYICDQCHREITDDDRVGGRWIKKYRDAEINGYWINQMSCVWHSAESIIEKSLNPKKDIFYNFTLGLPYVGSDVRPSRELIMRCVTPSPPRTSPIVMGIDQGKTFYVSIGSINQVHRLLTLESWDEVRETIFKVNPELVVIDGLPETNQVKELQDLFGINKVVPCFYKGNPEDIRIVRWELQSKDRRYTCVYADNFRTLDNLIRKIVDQQLSFHMSESNPMFQLFIRHAESMYRKEETNKRGQTFYVWDTSNKQDHFVHAINYMLMAASRYVNDYEEEEKPHEIYPGEDSPEELIEPQEYGLPDYIVDYYK